jgi:DNA polymerase-3 subunit delta
VEAILELVENNTQALRDECAPFFVVFPKGHVVSEADVEQLLAHNREESAFTLFSALADARKPANERLEQASLIAQKIRAAKSGGTVAMLMGLAWSFRRLEDWHAAFHGRTPAKDEMARARFFRPTQQQDFLRASRVWGPAGAARALALIAKTDASIRTGGAPLESIYVDFLLYKLTGVK